MFSLSPVAPFCLFSTLKPILVLTHGVPSAFLGLTGVYQLMPPTSIGPVPSFLDHCVFIAVVDTHTARIPV